MQSKKKKKKKNGEDRGPRFSLPPWLSLSPWRRPNLERKEGEGKNTLNNVRFFFFSLNTKKKSPPWRKERRMEDAEKEYLEAARKALLDVV